MAPSTVSSSSSLLVSSSSPTPSISRIWLPSPQSVCPSPSLSPDSWPAWFNANHWLDSKTARRRWCQRGASGNRGKMASRKNAVHTHFCIFLLLFRSSTVTRSGLAVTMQHGSLFAARGTLGRWSGCAAVFFFPDLIGAPRDETLRNTKRSTLVVNWKASRLLALHPPPLPPPHSNS